MRNKMKLLRALALALWAGGYVGGSLAANAAEPGPNILVILADDLGYSDLGSYGGEINTPHLDALAANGVRFTQMYNSARCCPSRASLLTGLYPHQAGMGVMAQNDQGLPGYRGQMGNNTVTIAEVLRGAGYHTFGSGKWHVGFPGPIERGFDEFYGFLEDYGVDSWEPRWMQRFPTDRPARTYPPGEFFATDAITDHALDFLDLAEQADDRPWFLYLSYQAPHFPVQAPPEFTAKYEETYHVGWDVIRARRFARMKELGVIPPETKLSALSPLPRPELAEKSGVPGDGMHNPAWEMLDLDRRADLAQRMAVFAGMVDNMDANIGRVVEHLRATGQLENTLILFMSDNGACGEWETFGFEYPDLDARVHGNTLLNPNVLHTGESLARLGGPDSPLFSYGSGWANAGNTPFTLYKMYTHEAGISTPFIMHWPARLRERGKVFTSRYAHFADIMATCVDVAETEYPATFAGHAITPLEGISILDTLTETVPADRVLTFEHWRHTAIREGDWKLVSKVRALGGDGFSEDPKLELYNIRLDRAETRDRAAEHPDKVARLRSKMLDEFRRTWVLPAP